jgi:hypothetical protein
MAAWPGVTCFRPSLSPFVHTLLSTQLCSSLCLFEDRSQNLGSEAVEPESACTCHQSSLSPFICNFHSDPFPFPTLCSCLPSQKVHSSSLLWHLGLFFSSDPHPLSPGLFLPPPNLSFCLLIFPSFCDHSGGRSSFSVTITEYHRLFFYKEKKFVSYRLGSPRAWHWHLMRASIT